MKKILIVDDEPLSRLVLKKLLESCYEVIESDNSIDAISKFYTLSPDLVLLDIILSKQNSNEGICVLKNMIAANPKAKIVMVSGLGSADIIQECKYIGAVDYIIKPCNKQPLFDLIKKYIAE